ncbi:CCR4-NOT transcription complex subunit 10-like isoform X1 [Ananas comosus]|uniref:CCR4-NOT transcription complex subunit 10-like isoform X1 n=1 Tax=Ananas comosus TaxID=4615 RepID=A0A6P5G432_ANACO|nr:CCR4-NOT transcription complex subunit 10-like isoform X1 [Ananas comosus]
MEGQDAASAVGKEGAAEEDGVVSASALAKEAAVLFQNRRYAEGVDILKQLLLKKQDDPKVLHNIAVAEYFHDGCPDPKKLLDVLDRVKKKYEGLAHSSREQVEAANGIASNATVGSRGNSNAAHQLSFVNNSLVAYSEEFDTSIVKFNTAVILYHLHDYGQALSVLNSLYQNIEPIDETTALHVCLLLLDIALMSQDATKAADIIQYLEKSFGVGNTINQNDNGSMIQHHSSNQHKLLAKSNTAPDVSNSDSTAVENPLVGNLSDDSLEYETLYSTLDSGAQNLGRPSRNDLSKTSADLAASAADLKLKLQLYKVRLLLLTRNIKVAKRELKLAMNMARGRDSSIELLLKSQLEYARGNHRKAVKLLSAPTNRTEPAMLTMFYNNLGCLHHKQKAHNTSNFFFTKALRQSSSFQSEKPLKLATFSQDKSRLISYNCGLQHLVCRKPGIAARCFREAVPLFYNRPLFWLRFAECSLLALEMGLLSSRSDSSSCSDGEIIKVHVVGSGKWRQVVVDPVNSANNYSGSGGDLLSLSFARQCLLNAQLLLDTSEEKTAKTGLSTAASEANNIKQAITVSSDIKANANGDPKGGASSIATLQSSVASYEDMCRKENHKIKQAILVDLAFTELCLGNYLQTLSVVKAVQQMPDCSRMYVFLSRLYAAEALCHLNRPKEAAEELATYIAEGKNTEWPFNDEDLEKWFEEKGSSDSDDNVNGSTNKKSISEECKYLWSLKPEEARGMLYVNLAVMSAVQGDLEQASSFMKQGLGFLPDNPKALLASLYLDLLQGKAQEALPKLRQSRHVRFLRSSVTVSS